MAFVNYKLTNGNQYDTVGHQQKRWLYVRTGKTQNFDSSGTGRADLVICLECGAVCKQLSNSHLRKCSGLSPSEYKLKHNLNKLADQETRNKCSFKGAVNGNWKDGVSQRKFYCGGCGARITGRGKSPFCPKCALVDTRNPFFGKRHSDQARKEMRKAHQVRSPLTYKGGNQSIGGRRKISEATRLTWSMLTPAQQQAKISLLAERGHAACTRNKNTRIEKVVAEKLCEFGVDYEQNTKVGIKYVDFLIRSAATIIECYGDYWHCNPQIYPSTFYNTKLHMTAEEKWNADAKRVEYLEGLGYSVYIIWETDILRHPYKHHGLFSELECESFL